ncbi:MAG TPA: Dabb family protein [Parafilimonas sp.]|nr:Dabb family protein [Parafilimonas sp.]
MRKILMMSLLLLTIAHANNLNAQNGNAVLRHIVIITFKTDAPTDSVKALDDLYRSLSKGGMVKDFETGVNISMRDTGVVKHVYVTSFASKEDMDSYRKMPDYSQLFKLSLPVASEVTVADYWTNK